MSKGQKRITKYVPVDLKTKDNQNYRLYRRIPGGMLGRVRVIEGPISFSSSCKARSCVDGCVHKSLPDAH